MLQDIMTLTEDMLALARADLWDEFLLRNEQRQQLTDQARFNPLSAQLPAEQLRQLFVLNNQLLEVVTQQRERQREALLLLQKNAKAATQYRRCS